MKEFIKLIEEMRNAQKEYFKGRNYQSLEKSKRLERQVDFKVKEYLDTQLNIFDNEAE